VGMRQPKTQRDSVDRTSGEKAGAAQLGVDDRGEKAERAHRLSQPRLVPINAPRLGWTLPSGGRYSTCCSKWVRGCDIEPQRAHLNWHIRETWGKDASGINGSDIMA